MDDSCDLFVLYRQYLSGGKIWLMLGLETNGSDYNDILAIAECLAESGHEVKVLHAVHYDEYMKQQIRGQIQDGMPVLSIWIFDGQKVRLLYNTEG